MEGVLAAFSQFDKEVRSEQTRGGMKAALELGHWTFLAPLGTLVASEGDLNGPTRPLCRVCRA